MTQNKLYFFLFSLLLLIWPSLGAGQTSTLSEIRPFYRGVRSLGMGGAHVSVVNDESALYLNPASLLKLRNSIGTLFDPEISLSDKAYNPIYSTHTFSSFTDPSALGESLFASPNEIYHAKYQISPTFVFEHFGIGLIANQSLDARFNSATNTVDIFHRDDQGFFIGSALRFFSGKIKIGGAAKLISRIEMNKNLPYPGDISLGTHASSGLALGYDGAVIFTAPWAYLPSFSIVGRDLGATLFDKTFYSRSSSSTHPQSVDGDVDVGLSFFPVHSNKKRSSVAIEYHSLLAAQNASDKTKYMHLGYEFNYGDLLFIRAGINQRYWTAGVELASEYTQIQLASYGEEVGPESTPTESRRYVFKWTFRF